MSCLDFLNLFDYSVNDHASIKNKRLRDSNTEKIGHVNVSPFLNKYQFFAGFFENFNKFLTPN